MAQRSTNPIRNAFKHGTESRNLKEVVKRHNEGLKKEARDATVRRRRNIVEEVSPSTGEEKQNRGTQGDKRREELLAWKARRDHQRQKEVKKRTKQGEFVVKHVQYSPPKYLVADGKKNMAKKTESTVEKQVTRRVTRSCTRIAASKLEEEKKKIEKEQTKVRGTMKPQMPSEKGLKKRTTRSSRKDEKALEEGCKVKDIEKPEQKGSAKKRNGGTGFGFNFTLEPNGAVPKTFNFRSSSPVTCFAESGFQDPIAHYNESLKNEKGKNSKNGEARDSITSFFKCEDPIAKFNESLKSEKEPGLDIGKTRNSVVAMGFDPIAMFNASSKSEEGQMMEGLKFDKKVSMDGSCDKGDSNMKICRKGEGIINAELEMDGSKKEDIELKKGEANRSPPQRPIMPVRVLRSTPQRVMARANLVNAEEGDSFDGTEPTNDADLKTPSRMVKGLPGKTPKRVTALPRHVTDEVDSERFTPRRIKSTKHFKQLAQNEREKFNGMNRSWQTYLETEELKEEVRGHIRTVIGQAQLLMDQRLKQFENLIQLHQSHQADKGATASDLHGFWDMINYQIEDVHNKFAELEKRKQGEWKSKETKKSKAKPKKVIEKKKSGGGKLTARQEATRKFKQAMRAKMQSLKNGSTEAGVDLLQDDSETKQLSQMEGNALAGSHSVSSDASRTDGFDDSARSRTSSSEMSSDSLEGEEETRGNHDGVNRQLCAALSNVNIDYKQESENLVDFKPEGQRGSPKERKMLRRSFRRTPSKYKTPLKDIENLWISREEKNKVKSQLFTEDIKKHETEGDFMKYLRPSISSNGQEDLFGLGFSSPLKKKREAPQIQEEVSLIKFD